MKHKVTMLENGVAEIEIQSPLDKFGRQNDGGWVVVREPGSSELKEPYTAPIHLNEDGTCVLYVKGQCNVTVYDREWAILEIVHNIVQEEAA